METTHSRALARARILIIAAIVTLIAALLVSSTHTPPASAHVPPCATIAIRQALADERPATAALVREYRIACQAVAKRHALEHRIRIAAKRCRDVRGSVIGRSVCAALARAAVERRVDAWSWSPALHELLRRESSGSPNAVNEGSGACGLFQRWRCPWRYYGGTASPHDDRVHASTITQTRNGLRYIAGRYGSPDAALRYHNAAGSY